MIDALFLIALLCACAAALGGVWTAMVLVAATSVSTVLITTGVAFDPLLWVLIDAGAIAAIAATKVSRWDLAVVALFLPLWAFYFDDSMAGYDGASLIASAQFLLAGPTPALWGCLQRMAKKRRERHGMEMVLGRCALT